MPMTGTENCPQAMAALWKNYPDIRKAEAGDAAAVAAIYARAIEADLAGEKQVGWVPEVYPTIEDARAALARDDLFVLERDGRVVASAIINQRQVDAYAGAAWQYPAEPRQVMVLHTLCVDPAAGGHGCGRYFVAFYEAYAAACGCPYLRMDTNARNRRARVLYGRLGYAEVGILPCEFNGIPGVDLVCLEKRLPSAAAE